MEDVNLVTEALKFMALGMGIVFLFLTIMVFALKFQAKIIKKYFPEEQKENLSEWKPQSAQSQPNVSDTDEKDTVAAITAAIIHYNNQKQKG